MTLNGEIALILRYFTEFDNGPYFALFHLGVVRVTWPVFFKFCPNHIFGNASCTIKDGTMSS